MALLVFLAAGLFVRGLELFFAQRGIGLGESLWIRYGLSLTAHPLRFALASALIQMAGSRYRAGFRATPGLGHRGTLVIIKKAYHAPISKQAAFAPVPLRDPSTRLAAPASIMSTSLRDSIITGPKDIPGLGATLTINPCQESFRSGVLLSQAVVVTTAASTIRELSRDGRKVVTILVDGEIDPLQHEDFRAISENLKDIAKKWYPRAKLHLIGYPRFVDSPGRAVALDFYKDVTLRLEAGTQKTFAAMTGENGSVYKRVLETLSRLDIGHLVVRTRFIRGDIDNSTPSEVRGWIKAIQLIKPMRIEVISPKKPFIAKTKGVTATRLKEIAAEAEEKTGIPTVILENA